MALGGGTFITQNKVLPGAYINFVSLNTANASLSDRGIATMPLELDWGVSGKVFAVTRDEFLKDSMKYFGYPYTHEKLKGLRDLFKNIHTLYAYRLNGGGNAASSSLFTARCSGAIGNKIKIVITMNENGTPSNPIYDIATFFDNTKVDEQFGIAPDGVNYVQNDYITYGGAPIESASTITLSGGSDGTVDGNAHQAYLDAIESYSFNTMGVVATDDTTKNLYVAFCKRMREELGVKFQLVVFNKAADYEGVINVKNSANLVYWVTGATAGCAVNKSNLNREYDGEFDVTADYTQTQLANAIKAGEFVFHRVGSTIRVLKDINSLVTTTDEKGDVFKENMTIRIIDQVANDMAVMFNDKYIGKIPNDESGRISLWNDIVKHHQELERIGAIENFNPDNVVVAKGDTKDAVVVTDTITPINAMAQLYMTVYIA